MGFISQVISEIIRRFSILIISLFLFIFFFIVGLAIWVFITQSGSNGVKRPPIQDDRSQILSTWKVYRNHDLNFELMHPPSASIIRRQEGGLPKIRINFSIIYPGFFEAKYLEISVTDEKEEVCKRETLQLNRKVENITLHGIGFVKEARVVNDGGKAREITDYYTVSNAQCYHLSFLVDFKGGFDFGYKPSEDVYYQQETRIFDIVLSTFGFINKPE